MKTTAFDLQLNPASPGLKFHRIDKTKDPNFWSLRVNADVRMIVHKTGTSVLLVFVGHHDNAYKWAERRKIERHPSTGAMQLVEIRERIEEFETRQSAASVPRVIPTKRRLFDNLRKIELMAFGVPEDWVDYVRLADEDTLLDVIVHLPLEAQEALLRLATGEQPEPPKALPEAADPFTHPDAQRRFRVLAEAQELERALDYPWEKWIVFLHPDQRSLVERSFAGPVRLSGSAGTGKSIVALHRAVHLARHAPELRVLLTTFSTTLANALKAKLAHLAGNEPSIAGRITVEAIHDLARRMYLERIGRLWSPSAETISSLLSQAAVDTGHTQFSERFLQNEWTDVVDAWNLLSWEEYRDVTRLGRRTRLGEKQREQLWEIFSAVRSELAARNLRTYADVMALLATNIVRSPPPFDYVVADEAQDFGVAEIRFLAVLAAERTNALFLAGDLGQRIFQTPFSWRALGVDVAGRSHTLRINYRTSHQIRAQADRLLPQSITDVDGLVITRRGTVSVFNGPPPEIIVAGEQREEVRAVGAWIAARLCEGYRPEEIGLFVRSEAQLDRARQALEVAQVKHIVLGPDVVTVSDHVSISTMHLAKGLEFRGVAVIACDTDVLPLQQRIEAITDEFDLEEVYNTERHLLYVACTRARDRLLISGVNPASEFLSDLRVTTADAHT